MGDYHQGLPPPLQSFRNVNRSAKKRPGDSEGGAVKRRKNEASDANSPDFDGPFPDEDKKTCIAQLDSGETLTIYNVLASGSLFHDGKLPKFNLDFVADLFQNSYLERVEFTATRIDMRYQSAMYAVSVFENGRIQSTGGVDPLMTKYVLRKIAKHIAKKLPNLYYQKCAFKNFEVQNILGVIDLGTLIPLKRLIETVPGGADYEPERFPAARFRIPVEKSFDMDIGDDLHQKAVQRKLKGEQLDTRSRAEKQKELQRINKEEKQEHVTINVYGTGKVTFQGARSVESISYAWGTLLPYIQRCLEY